MPKAKLDVGREWEAINEVLGELIRAQINNPTWTSEHHGWAVIREEVDELWDEVKKKSSKRSRKRLRAEAKQVAATAIRFMLDLT